MGKSAWSAIGTPEMVVVRAKTLRRITSHDRQPHYAGGRDSGSGRHRQGPQRGAVLSALDAYFWPGNVRELQNIVRRMCVLADGHVISMRDLPAELSQVPDRSPSVLAETAAGIGSCELGFGAAKIQYVRLFEASYL